MTHEIPSPEAFSAGLQRIAAGMTGKGVEPLQEVLATIAGLHFHPLFQRGESLADDMPTLPPRLVGGCEQ